MKNMNREEAFIIKRASYIKRIKNRIKLLLSTNTIVLRIYYLFAPQYRDRIATKQTELVIEGFPRSANTFAYIAFQKAQGREDITIAHHLHLAAQIKRGVYLNIPVLILIRKPEDAVRSLCVRHPEASQRRALQNWIKFYQVAEKYRNYIVLGEFEQVTKNFGEIIKCLNKKYSRSYSIFESSEENISSVFVSIERFNDQHGENNELQVNRPSIYRQTIYKNMSIEQGTLLDRANELYFRLLEKS